MKTILAISLFTASVCFGQQKITVPVEMNVTFTLPAQTNTPNTIVRKKVVLTSNVITPQPLGVSLVKRLTMATQFTLGAFPQDAEVLLEIVNPARHRIGWPTGLQVIGGPLPTNAARASIILSETLGEIWCYSTIQ